MSDESSGSIVPIHDWFGLSYANYLVIPRSVLQSLPRNTQLDLVDILEEANRMFGEYKFPTEYQVRVVDERGNTTEDPLGDYQRGRRRLTAREEK